MDKDEKSERGVMETERILVVDDEIDIRTVLKMHLERAGYRVETADDGLAGLERIQNDPPDLILLDVMMPRMDGNEVCRRLKSDFATSQIPVILVTAKAELRDRVEGLSTGANDYITKPYTLEELLVRVRNILHWSRVQRAANPLTGLPGNVAIEAEASRRIATDEKFAFLYVDIDRFKAFNDRYGYVRGDVAIKETARIILDAIHRVGGPTDFVGHVGGDDFVAFCDPEEGWKVANEIKQNFNEMAPLLYDEVDRNRGYLEIINRQGEITRVSHMTLTIAVVTNVEKSITHVGLLSDLSAQMKRHGKERGGDMVLWDRRGD